jgi:hypothetical protein
VKEVFYHKATLVPHRLGVYVFPAVHNHLKPVVMTALLMRQYNASESLRPAVMASLQNRFELHDVKIVATDVVTITALIKEEGRPDVEFSDEYFNVLILDDQS